MNTPRTTHEPPTIWTARRVMKARRTSQCTLCHTPVRIGQQIGLLDTGWAHTTCINTARTGKTSS